MGNSIDGRFTANLISLQLQLKTLLEDAGGDGVVRLLDALCKLSSAEQLLALDVLTNVIDRIASGDIRVTSEKDREMRALEDNLYKDIVRSMHDATNGNGGNRKLEVLRGGKGEVQDKRLIDINEARTARKNSAKPVLN